MDGKIFTSILAQGLHPLMPGLTDPDQTGFIQGRHCYDYTKKTLHLTDRRTNEEKYPISDRREKTFDEVHWPYLREN